MRTLLALVLTLCLGATSLAAQTRLLVVSGLGGEPGYSEEFYKLGAAMVDAAHTRYGLAADQVTFLAESPERDTARINGESTSENVESALLDMSREAGARDAIFLLLIGHGSSDGRSSRLNLPGPDLSAAELGKSLDRFSTQPIVVVNTTSASGGFQEPLTGKNRTIITATRSGLERNETVFARYFVDAFAGDGADADKDGRVSLLEAFDYTTREVERFYKTGDLLQSEHAMMSGDSVAAQRFYLAAGPAGAPAGASPQLQALLAEQKDLAIRIDSLKAAKEQTDPVRYQQQLEELLVQLSLKSREIREQEGKQ